MSKNRIFIIPLVIVLVSLACGTSGPSAQDSTLQAISDQIRLTGTAAASNQGLDPVVAAQTAEALATQGISLDPQSQTATAAVEGPILAELPKYGVDPSEGKLAWIHPPVSLDASGYNQYEYVNHFLGTVATDFVMSADITWDTVGSTSGCGFVVRTDGNKEAVNQYVAILTRVAQGHFLFATMSKGEVVTGQDFYPHTNDKSFNWENLTTNRLTLVGRGNHFSVYTNGTFVGEVDPSAPPPAVSLPPAPKLPDNQKDPVAMGVYLAEKAQYDATVQQIKADNAARQKAFKNANTVFERGFVAMVAVSQAGRKTVCSFDNAWLFLIGG